MALTTDTLTASDGATLYVAHQLPADEPKAVVVLVHGHGEHSGRYLHVIDALTDAGYAVCTLDHRGHGRSSGVRGFIPSMHVPAADLREYIRRIKADHPARRLIVYGHSMGALISLIFALENPDALDGLILSGTPLLPDEQASPLLVRVAQALNAIAPRLALKRMGEPGWLSSDPQVEIDYAADPLNYNRPMRVGTGVALYNGALWARERLDRLRVPLFLLHGAEDKLVTPRGSDVIAARAASTDKTLTHYPGMRHEPHNEIDRDRVIRDVIAWLDARWGG